MTVSTTNLEEFLFPRGLTLLSIGDKESRQSRFALSPWNEAAGGEVGSRVAKGESKWTGGVGTLEEAMDLTQGGVISCHSGGGKAPSDWKEAGEGWTVAE